MARLVDDLLSLSRIEMNEHLAPTERIDIEQVLRTVADTLEQRAAARDMRIVLDLPAALPEVLGNADELAQVFQNLLDNAIKYSRRGTTIDVGAHPSPRFLPGARPGERPAALAITVRDHGEGMRADIDHRAAPAVFDRVVEQVLEHLGQLVGIAQHRRERRPAA